MTDGLIEYRCTCGRLLCRGVINLSIVELKCKRCNKINLIYELDNGIDQKSAIYVLLMEESGMIIATSENASKFLGYTPTELKHMNILSIDKAMTQDYLQKVFTDYLMLDYQHRQTHIAIINTTHQTAHGFGLTIHASIRFIWGQKKVYSMIIAEQISS